MSATKQEPEMTFENAAAMGLSKEEWDLILTRLGRTPNMCELGIFSAMWSEHCSYKSSKKWLKTLPIDGPQVIGGPRRERWRHRYRRRTCRHLQDREP